MSVLSSSVSSPPAAGSLNKKISTLAKAFNQVDLDGHDLPPSPAPSSPRPGRQYSIATELVYADSTDQYNASSVPIYQVCLGALTYMNSVEAFLFTRQWTDYALDSLQLSSRPLPRVESQTNTTTRAPVTPPEQLLKST